MTAPHLSILRNYRLLPLQIVPSGIVIWCAKTIFAGKGELHSLVKPSSPDIDTACLSVEDYRRVTGALADREENGRAIVPPQEISREVRI